ncbi:hypothetical protein TIFTF001_026520 [Ficus carica]|uniref:Uncharacterized protein n=1 Tax=Ficus carica TaxID=3494 RepID=A0AA88IYG2_FICCA|nr:hypothetical protein TIFTF001_026520 [Ficus carica]
MGERIRERKGKRERRERERGRERNEGRQSAGWPGLGQVVGGPEVGRRHLSPAAGRSRATEKTLGEKDNVSCCRRRSSRRDPKNGDGANEIATVPTGSPQCRCDRDMADKDRYSPPIFLAKLATEGCRPTVKVGRSGRSATRAWSVIGAVDDGRRYVIGEKRARREKEKEERER